MLYGIGPYRATTSSGGVKQWTQVTSFPYVFLAENAFFGILLKIHETIVSTDYAMLYFAAGIPTSRVKTTHRSTCTAVTETNMDDVVDCDCDFQFHVLRARRRAQGNF